MKKFVGIILVIIFTFAFPTTAYGRRLIKRFNIISSMKKRKIASE